MRYLRLFLLVASLIGVAWLALAARVFAGDYQGEYVAAFFLALAALVAANAYYLFEARVPNAARAGRFMNLFRLWLDAKEKDLRRRASSAD